MLVQHRPQRGQLVGHRSPQHAGHQVRQAGRLGAQHRAAVPGQPVAHAGFLEDRHPARQPRPEILPLGPVPHHPPAIAGDLVQHVVGIRHQLHRQRVAHRVARHQPELSAQVQQDRPHLRQRHVRPVVGQHRRRHRRHRLRIDRQVLHPGGLVHARLGPVGPRMGQDRPDERPPERQGPVIQRVVGHQVTLIATFLVCT